MMSCATKYALTSVVPRASAAALPDALARVTVTELNPLTPLRLYTL